MWLKLQFSSLYTDLFTIRVSDLGETNIEWTCGYCRFTRNWQYNFESDKSKIPQEIHPANQWLITQSYRDIL